MEHLKTFAALVAAHPFVGASGTALLGVLQFFYGNGITLTVMALFSTVLLLDWISGRAASKKDGSYASEYGINGGYRTAFILILLSAAYHADNAIGDAAGVDLPYPIFFYLIANFGLPMWRSMTANVYRAGWNIWIPERVLNRVADEIEHKTARANKRIEERNQYTQNNGGNE